VEGADLVRAWIAAWNARDVGALLGLADENVVMEMPRGVARGAAAVRDLLGRQSYGVRVFVGPQHLHVLGETVVAVGPIEFRQVEEDDRVVAREEGAAAVFALREGRVARFKTYPDAVAALAGEGLPAGALADNPPAACGQKQ
jgi:ketosteroid isomerase-like protein